jgi:hypothetical protein
MRHTLTPKQNRQVPQLRHIERLENLSLIASTITIQRNSRILVPIVLMCERESSTDRNLCTDDTIATIEALGKHVHGASLAVRNAFTTTQELPDDRFDGCAAHEGEAVAAVGSDNIILLGEGVLNSNGNCFLACGEMAETADLLLFVKSVGGHFHTAGRAVSFLCLVGMKWDLPNGYHIIVHLLQLLLRRLHRVGWGIQLVCLE